MSLAIRCKKKPTVTNKHHGDVEWSWPFQIPEEIDWAHLKDMKVELKSRLRRETFKNSFVQSRSVECRFFHVLHIMSFNYDHCAGRDANAVKCKWWYLYYYSLLGCSWSYWCSACSSSWEMLLQSTKCLFLCWTLGWTGSGCSTSASSSTLNIIMASVRLLLNLLGASITPLLICDLPWSNCWHSAKDVRLCCRVKILLRGGDQHGGAAADQPRPGAVRDVRQQRAGAWDGRGSPCHVLLRPQAAPWPLCILELEHLFYRFRQISLKQVSGIFSSALKILLKISCRYVKVQPAFFPATLHCPKGWRKERRRGEQDLQRLRQLWPALKWRSKLWRMM